jgi:hypothetical protein
MHLTLFRDDDIVKDTCLSDGTTVLLVTSRQSGFDHTTKVTISKGSGEDFMMSLCL